MNRLVFKSILTAALTLSLGATIGVSTASATTILTFNTCNSPCSLGTGPYATLSVNLTSSTTIDFVITAVSPYGLVDGSAFAFNTTDNISFSNLVSVPNIGAIAQAANNQQVDGFGTFKYVFDSGNASTLHSSFSFTATLLGGGTWVSDLDAFNANASGNIAAIHVAQGGSNCGGSPCTGFATLGSTSVPDGGTTVGLLGLAMLGLGYLRRRIA